MQIFVKIGEYYFEISQFEKFVVTLPGPTPTGEPLCNLDNKLQFFLEKCDCVPKYFSGDYSKYANNKVSIFKT